MVSKGGKLDIKQRARTGRPPVRPSHPKATRFGGELPSKANEWSLQKWWNVLVQFDRHQLVQKATVIWLTLVLVHKKSLRHDSVVERGAVLCALQT